MDASHLPALLGIIGIDLLLSGDNAVVIALVCAQLPAHQQRIGLVLGALMAVMLRIAFALGLDAILFIPGLSIAAGAMLLWIAVKMTATGDETHAARPATSLWRAILVIGAADVGMSADNVIAIAGLAHGHPWLMAFGVALSIPLVIGGSAIVTRLLARWPALVWVGAALLGWVAGGVVATDPLVRSLAGSDLRTLHHVLAAVGLVGVLNVALAWRAYRTTVA